MSTRSQRSNTSSSKSKTQSKTIPPKPSNSKSKSANKSGQAAAQDQSKALASSLAKSGSKNWTNDETIALLNITQAILPIGRDGWKMVSAQLNKQYRINRDYEQCKRKFTNLKHKEIPTGGHIETLQQRAIDIEEMIRENHNIKTSSMEEEEGGEENEADQEEEKGDPEVGSSEEETKPKQSRLNQKQSVSVDISEDEYENKHNIGNTDLLGTDKGDSNNDNNKPEVEIIEQKKSEVLQIEEKTEIRSAASVLEFNPTNQKQSGKPAPIVLDPLPQISNKAGVKRKTDQDPSPSNSSKQSKTLIQQQIADIRTQQLQIAENRNKPRETDYTPLMAILTTNQQSQQQQAEENRQFHQTMQNQFIASQERQQEKFMLMFAAIFNPSSVNRIEQQIGMRNPNPNNNSSIYTFPQAGMI